MGYFCPWIEVWGRKLRVFVHLLNDVMRKPDSFCLSTIQFLAYWLLSSCLSSQANGSCSSRHHINIWGRKKQKISHPSPIRHAFTSNWEKLCCLTTHFHGIWENTILHWAYCSLNKIGVSKRGNGTGMDKQPTVSVAGSKIRFVF